MKTYKTINRISLALLAVIMFTTATGSFASMVCRPICIQPVKSKPAEEKKATLPVLNPMQILSAKFL